MTVGEPGKIGKITETTGIRRPMAVNNKKQNQPRQPGNNTILKNMKWWGKEHDKRMNESKRCAVCNKSLFLTGKQKFCSTKCTKEYGRKNNKSN